MAINFQFSRRIILLLFLFFIAPAIHAQAGFFLDPDSEQPRFIQRLSWRSAGENTLRYEVLIEKQENRTYRSHLREFTTELFINVSLHPGNYRFCVIPYNLLDRPDVASQWMPFTVLPALKPEINNIVQEIVQTDGVSYHVFRLEGENLTPDSQIIFSQNGKIKEPVRIVNSGAPKTILLFFERADITEGDFEISVKNPGGLEAGLSDAAILPEEQIAPEEAPSFRTFVFNAGAALMPVFPIYGDVFGNGITPAGAVARASAGFPVQENIYIGPELTFSWYYPDNISFGLNALITKWIENTIIALNFRFGMEYVLRKTGNPSNVVAGFSISWRIKKQMAIEAGMDYANTFNRQDSGALRPWAGFGIQF
jgi:hypothetical protein